MGDVIKEEEKWSLEEEEERVRKAQEDSEEFARLYEYYRPRVFHYVFKKLNKREIAEDLTSLTFEKALRNLGTFRWQGVSFSAWLFRIARNTINDYLRKLLRRGTDVQLDLVESIIADPQKGIVDIMIRDEEELTLFTEISRLKNEDQYLLYYKFFEGKSNKEIARITGLSETNVGTRLHRIRQRMGRFISGL